MTKDEKFGFLLFLMLFVFVSAVTLNQDIRIMELEERIILLEEEVIMHHEILYNNVQLTSDHINDYYETMNDNNETFAGIYHTLDDMYIYVTENR